MTETRPEIIERVVLLTAVAGTGLVYLDQTAVTVALPTIQTELGVPLGGLQWLVDSYILTMATLLLIGGALGDRYGRVKTFIIGTVIFIVSSAAVALGQSLSFLIVARAIQGIGGALLVPSGLAMINATVSAERRGQVLGSWTMFSSMLVAMGPVLGGFLVDEVSWRAVFIINVPIGLVGLYLAWRYLPESRNEKVKGELDWIGVLSLLVGLGGLLFGLIEGSSLGWTHPLVTLSWVGGLLILPFFIYWELQVDNPLIPLHFFKNRVFAGINLVTLLHWMSLSGVFFFLTLNYQQVQGYDAKSAGLANLPISILIWLLSNPVGRLTDKFGPRRLILTGLVVSAVGLYLFGLPGLNADYRTDFLPAILLFGFGMALTIVPVTTVALSALDTEFSGIASGVNNAASRVANMLGIALFGAFTLVVFRPALDTRLAEVSVRYQNIPTQAILAQARDLSGIDVDSFELSDAAAPLVQESIHLSFLKAFRQMMFLCAAISLSAMVVAFFTVPAKPRRAAEVSMLGDIPSPR